MIQSEKQPPKIRMLSTPIVAQLVLVIGILPFLPMIVPWRWNWWEAWVYASINIVGFVVSRMLISTDLQQERARSTEHENIEPWDRHIVKIIGVGLIAVPLTAGLEALFGQTLIFAIPLKLVAIAMMIAGYAFGTWALVTNRFFSGVVRIQTDRVHVVISGGPYRLVRHPGYLGGLIVYLATPILLDSLWAFLPVTLLGVVFVVRTALEDRTLQEKLPGYAGYAQKTRYRLLPGVW